MITLNITPEGEITVSQEAGSERAAMHAVYQNDELNTGDWREGYQSAEEDMREGTISGDTEIDEMRASFFAQGWESAVREAQLNYVNGRLEEFFQEMKVGEISTEQPSEDPHHNEPEGTGEDRADDDLRAAGFSEDDLPAAGWSDSEFAANEIGLNVIKPVTDSGEPELEAETVAVEGIVGTWTMSSFELQSRLDAAYNRGYEQKVQEEYDRGRRDGSTDHRQTTERALRIIAVETDAELHRNGDYSVMEGQVGPTRGQVFGAFAIAIAKRLGFEVAS